MALTRLQVDIDSEELERLEELRVLGGLRTKKELWNIAFTLLEWAANQKARGASIVAVSEEDGTVREPVMPFLETYARRWRSKVEEVTSNGSGRTAAAAAAGPRAAEPKPLRAATRRAGSR